MIINNQEIQESKLNSICKRYSLIEVALIGSVLREDFNNKSDIDLLIEFSPDNGFSLFDLVELKEEFEKLFSREVDIVSKRAIEKSKNNLRKKAILENYKVIYAS